MEEIQIMLKYSGVWIADNVYEKNRIEGIVICANTNYKKLTDEIALQLRIDQTRKKIRMRYIVEGNLIPMEIHNEMGVKLYVSLKKKICDFTKYPLCIDITDMEIESCSSGQESFDTVTGAIECVDYECGLQLISSPTPLSIDDMNMPQIITDPNHKPVQVGQVYRNKKTIISVMHNFALDNRFQFYIKRSDRRSYVLICFCEDCPWIFKASCIGESDLFKVRSFNNIHTCPLNERRITQRQATTKLIAAVSIPNLTNHKRKHTANDIKEDMKRIMGVNIDYQKAWRARELALKIIRGGPADGYLNMPRYLYMLESFYPGSYIRLHKSLEYQFMYLFIALYPSIRGFDHCRPIVVVDGSAMRGSYLGTFISACTLDGAGNILPLAYGVVDTENDASWTWFFEQFKGAFGVRPNMGIVSDRNESIWKSVAQVFPGVPHFACIWHLWRNVCTKYRRSRTTLSRIYYDMAKVYRRDEFEFLMSQVEKIDNRVKVYLLDVGYEKWARSYAPVNRGRMTTSNMAECINSCLVEDRKLPILDFLENARALFAKWKCINGERTGYTATELGKRFQDILNLNEIRSTRLTVVKSSESIYSVDEAGHRFIVSLQEKTCSCGRFQYDELPCPHVIAVLKSKNITVYKPYCSDYYKPETIVKTYEISFPPMPDKSEWSAPPHILEEIVLPPKYKRPPGRPKNGRVKDKSETLRSKINCCSKCGREGHNRRSCNFFPKVY